MQTTKYSAQQNFAGLPKLHVRAQAYAGAVPAACALSSEPPQLKGHKALWHIIREHAALAEEPATINPRPQHWEGLLPEWPTVSCLAAGSENFWSGGRRRWNWMESGPSGGLDPEGDKESYAPSCAWEPYMVLLSCVPAKFAPFYPFITPHFPSNTSFSCLPANT